jgi:hypothetical protein
VLLALVFAVGTGQALTDPAHPVTVTHWLVVHRVKSGSVAKGQPGS